MGLINFALLVCKPLLSEVLRLVCPKGRVRNWKELLRIIELRYEQNQYNSALYPTRGVGYR